MSRNWKQGLLALPGVAVSLLPKLACPICWPAYAGLLSSVGLGFLISTAYLLPLTLAFLSLTLVALAFRAKNRRGFGPFLMGLVAAIAILLGKFLWESNLTPSLDPTQKRESSHTRRGQCPLHVFCLVWRTVLIRFAFAIVS